MAEFEKSTSEEHIVDKNFTQTIEHHSRQFSRDGWLSQIGVVLFAGRTFDGTTRVQFNVGNEGWSSEWSEWAFEMASKSLLDGKKLWVISDGVPFGRNLKQVHITIRSINDP